MSPSNADQGRLTRRIVGWSLLCVGFAAIMVLSAVFAPADNSPAGIAALLLPFVGGCLALVAAAVILRALSRWEVSSNLARVLVLSGPALLMLLLGPSLLRHQQRGKAMMNDMATCAGNMRVIMDVLMDSAAPMGGGHPSSTDWAERVAASAVANDLVCPARPDLPSGYALNSSLPGTAVGMVQSPESVVFVFESDAGRGAVGGPDLLPHRPRHFGGDNYGFADGTVKWLARKKLPDGGWAKEPDADWVIWEPMLKDAAEQE